MTDQPTPQGDGPLTREQAHALIMQENEPAPAAPIEAAPEPEQETPATPEAETPEPAAETPSEDGAGEETTVATVDPPPFWSAEDKAAFAQLPPELQQKVLGYERNRDVATSKALQEAKEAEKRHSDAAQKAAEVSAKLDGQIGLWEQRFAAKWPDKIDWAATAEQYGVEPAMKLKLEYDAEREELAAARTAKQEAEQQARRQFAQQEFERLKTIAPELTDPKQGPALFQKVTGFLAEKGIGSEQLADAGAVEWGMALDAMRWRDAQAAAKAKAATPAAKPAPVKAVAPVAATTPGNSEQREVQRLQNRYAQTGAREDAVALIMAKGL